MRGHDRTVELTHEKTVIIRDEIKAPKPVEALWGMVTDAQVTINHNHAKLEKNSSTLEAEIIFPKGAVFDTVSTTPPSPEEDQNKGTRKLVVRLKGKVTSTVIEVIFR